VRPTSRVSDAGLTHLQIVQHREILTVGMRIAEEAGISNPSVRDAVWELLAEAADTLKRLPDRERRWLRPGSYSSWPQALREIGNACEIDDVKSHKWEPVAANRAPPTSGAVGRREVVMLWLGKISGRAAQVETRLIFALAAGVPARLVRRRFGIGRRTAHDVRDRGLGKICRWLETEIAACGTVRENSP